MPTLLCPVGRCGRALTRGDRIVACPAGHSFDVARSGYVNLLQPQDRRSRHPGDSADTAGARRRVSDAGHEQWIVAEILAELDALGLSAPAVLDVGCGDGFLLGSLAAARPIDAHGTDISVPAIELAAKRHPEATWVVANADRFLPWADGSFDLVTSITARRNGPEFRRLLAPGGRALVALPGEDDLIELREALLGRGTRRDRAGRAEQDLAADFTLLSRRTVRRSARLEAAAVRDLLAATYRGGRTREHERISAIGPLEVTLSRDFLLFRPR